MYFRFTLKLFFCRTKLTWKRCSRIFLPTCVFQQAPLSLLRMLFWRLWHFSLCLRGYLCKPHELSLNVKLTFPFRATLSTASSDSFRCIDLSSTGFHRCEVLNSTLSCVGATNTDWFCQSCDKFRIYKGFLPFRSH